MATFLDLPEEVYQLIAKLLGPKAIYYCIHVCRSFYCNFISSLWKVSQFPSANGKAIDAAHIRANAHHVETANYTSALTEEYYNIAFPRLRAVALANGHLSNNKKDPPEQPFYKVQFIRLNPSVRKLSIHIGVKVPRGFWEAIETE
ncbi:hypothetical protein BGX23_006896 [Mortierella sp. AD031]|nr:hypothetical protein BGX23_006896 [Mortierella sp. AD031]